jgi:hypothetical protein
LLESTSSSGEVATCLSHHLQKRATYLGLGSTAIWKPFELKSVTFEAFAPYAGHGLSLKLYRLCELYADPFDPTSAAKPRAAAPLRAAFEQIEELHATFRTDRLLRQHVTNVIFASYGDEHRSYLSDTEPDLNFVAFAGRRSFIDANAERKKEWGRLREHSSVIELKTYDALIDAFREYRRE